MKTLRLTVKKQWFDMLLSGEKKEEYREIKEFWSIRFFPNYLGKNCSRIPEDGEEYGEYELRNYDLVEFTNGYGKDKPAVTFECKGIKIGQGNAEWGAPAKDVFIIQLGKEVSRANVK